tara:strand:+ start:910 stop:1854 length:945 start_codon:yes stop_codon:yes gene_type:complete
VDSAISHLSLCSGIGGIDIAIKRIFPMCRTIAYVENEVFACANLVQKMEKGLLDTAPIWTDLRTFAASGLSGLVDILSAGFPCQPFSAAGYRRSDEDSRHLFPQITRVIDECQPNIVFLENVEGIISSRLGGAKKTSILRYVLAELERRGYKTAWGIFSASEVGAPHRRRRVFILSKKIVAYTEAKRLHFGESKNVFGSNGGQNTSLGFKPGGAGSKSGNMADTVGAGLERLSRSNSNDTSRKSESRYVAARGVPVDCHRWRDWWLFEPDVGRVAHGIPERVDRIRLLGNAVVPHQAVRAFVVLMKEIESGEQC